MPDVVIVNDDQPANPNQPCPILLNVANDRMGVGIMSATSGDFAAIDLFYPEADLDTITLVAKEMELDGQLPRVYIFEENGGISVIVIFRFKTTDEGLVNKLAEMDLDACLREAGAEIPPGGFEIIFSGESSGWTKEQLEAFLSQVKRDKEFVVGFAKQIGPNRSRYVWATQLTKFETYNWTRDYDADYGTPRTRIN